MRKIEKAKTYWIKPEKRKTIPASIYFYLLTLLAIYCTARIITDRYEIFSMGSNEFLSVAIALLILSALGLSRDDKKRNIILFGIVLGGILLCEMIVVHYAWDSETSRAYSSIGNIIIKEINSYYKTSYSYGIIKDNRIRQGIMIVAFPFLGIFFYIADWMKKNWLILILPTISLVLILLVGKKPRVSTLFIYAFCILLFVSADWLEIFNKEEANIIKTISPVIICYVVTIIITAVICIFGNSLADKVLLKKDDFSLMQKKLENDVKNVVDYFTESDHTIDNHTPSFTGKTVLTVKVNKSVNGAMYLSDFVGDEYVDGEWITNDKQQKFDYEDLYNNLYNLFLDYNGSYRAKTAEISYFGKKTSASFAPYGTYYNGSDALRVDSNLLLSKDSGIKNLKVNFLSSISSNKVRRLIEYERQNSNTNFSKYSEYVKKTDLAVNKNVPTAIEMGDILKTMNDYYASLYNADSYIETVFEDGYVISENGAVEEIDAETQQKIIDYKFDDFMYSEADMNVNMHRYDAASFLQNYFAENYIYSTSLKPIPDGSDAVEYFLSTSKTGYCVHFATAGVLILREMGIPARYAAGYIIPQEDFRKLQDKTYMATVRDSAAHAWVEVYFEGIGWLPIEMTPGSGDNSVKKKDAVASEEGEKPNSEEATSENNTEVNNNSETEIESETESESETATKDSESSEIESEQKQSEISNKNGESSNSEVDRKRAEERVKLIKKYILKAMPFLGICLVIGVGVFIYRKRERMLEIKITSEISKKHYHYAVKLINRRIVKRLKKMPTNVANLNVDLAGIRHKGFRDEDVERLLKRYFEQGENDLVDQYMEIVKKMAYSESDISKEEVDICYILYGLFKKKK